MEHSFLQHSPRLEYLTLLLLHHLMSSCNNNSLQQLLVNLNSSSVVDNSNRQDMSNNSSFSRVDMDIKQLEDKALFNKVIKRVSHTNHQEVETVTLATKTPVISPTTSEDKTVLEATTEEEVREDEGSEVAEEEVMTEVVVETVTEVEEEDITMIEEVTAETMTDKEGSVDMVRLEVAARGVVTMAARTGAQPPGSSLLQDHLQQGQCQTSQSSETWEPRPSLTRPMFPSTRVCEEREVKMMVCPRLLLTTILTDNNTTSPCSTPPHQTVSRVFQLLIRSLKTFLSCLSNS